MGPACDDDEEDEEDEEPLWPGYEEGETVEVLELFTDPSVSRSELLFLLSLPFGVVEALDWLDNM